MKNKKGFTVAEMLITLGIISVLTGAAIFTFKPFDKGIKYLYSNVYQNLDRAFYNIVVYDIPKNNFSDPFADTNASGAIYVRSDEADPGTELLCKRLMSYISTIENENDNNVCSSTKLIPKSASKESFTEDKVQFTAVNGVRFFLSRMYPENPSTPGERFYVIYADLNGSNGPNSVEYIPPSASNHNKTTDPDIFAFAALETGRICPLGAAEVDMRYLSTRIKYPDDTNGLIYKYTVDSQPYIYSKAEAWGYYLPKDAIPQNAGKNENDKDSVPDDYVIPNGTPYSYNGYIKEILKSETGTDSNIYSFLLYDPANGGSKSTIPITMSEYFQHSSMAKDSNGKFNVTLRSNAINDPDAPGYNCRLKSDEECEVIIDKYKN